MHGDPCDRHALHGAPAGPVRPLSPDMPSYSQARAASLFAGLLRGPEAKARQPPPATRGTTERMEKGVGTPTPAVHTGLRLIVGKRHCVVIFLFFCVQNCVLRFLRFTRFNTQRPLWPRICTQCCVFLRRCVLFCVGAFFFCVGAFFFAFFVLGGRSPPRKKKRRNT